MVEKHSNPLDQMKRPKSKINEGLKSIKNELETIGSIALAIKATSVLEKILWIAFFVVGIGWLGYFLKGTIKDENPKTSIRLPLKIKDLDYPAITICSDLTPKYAFAEHLSNSVETRDKLPAKLELLRRKVLKNIIKSRTQDYFYICSFGSKAKYCKDMAKLINYAMMSQKTFSEIEDKFFDHVLQSVPYDFDVLKLYQNFFDSEEENEVNITEIISFTDHLDYAEAESLNRLFGIVVIIQLESGKLDWSTENFGSSFVRYALDLGSGSVADDIAIYPYDIDDIFTQIGHNVSMLDIITMYNSMNVRSLQVSTPARYLEPEPCDYTDLFSSCTYEGNQRKIRISEFTDCFEEVKAVSQYLQNEHWTSLKEFGGDNDKLMLPCRNKSRFSTCAEYCTWHEIFFAKRTKQEFLTMMKYSIPQGRMAVDLTEEEAKLSEKLFDSNSIKALGTKLIAPYPMVVYCHQKDEGFTGFDFNISAKLCDDFFQTPTDSGICQTKNLDIKSFIHDSLLENYNQILEPDQRGNKKIKSGTIWGEVSLLLQVDTEISRFKSQGRKGLYPSNQIQLQLNQAKEFSNLHIPDEYGRQDVPLTLKWNTEYTIEVTPFGKQSSEQLIQLDIDQRACKLENEMPEDSIFKLYTYSNCRYECHVKLSAERCQCIPWDFLHLSSAKECDVFGRSCFFSSMKNVTQFPIEQCPHCLIGCDHVKFRKEIVSQTAISTTDELDTYSKDLSCKATPDLTSNVKYSYVCKGQREFLDYFYDTNKTFVDKGYQNMSEIRKDWKGGYSYLRARELLSNSVIIHLKFMQPEIDLISVKYTFMDKLATFGGNFGIFEMVTGWSLFGILNLILLVIKCLLRFNN